MYQLLLYFSKDFLEKVTSAPPNRTREEDRLDGRGLDLMEENTTPLISFITHGSIKDRLTTSSPFFLISPPRSVCIQEGRKE